MGLPEKLNEAAKTARRRASLLSPSRLARAGALRIWPAAPLTKAYFRQRFKERRWRRTNLDGLSVSAGHPPIVVDPRGKLATTLRQKGIVKTDLEALWGPNGPDLEALKSLAGVTFATAPKQAEIAERQSRSFAEWNVVTGFGSRGPVILPPLVARLALDERLLMLAASYLGVAPRLIYTDFWYNIPAGTQDPVTRTERWHRDHDDIRILKVFVYLSDVGARDGALTYLPETHLYGAYAKEFPPTPPQAVFLSRETVAEALPLKPFQATGTAGDVVLVDTTGLHFGGRSEGAPRLLLKIALASEACLDKTSYRLDDLSLLGPYGHYALTGTYRLPTRGPTWS